MSTNAFELTQVAKLATLYGMKVVGVKVLKDNLSKYLKLVEEGETVWVTHRDEVIAEIHRPTHPLPTRVSRWDAFLNDEERRGSIQRAKPGYAPSLLDLNAIPRPEIKIDLQALLDEIRAD